jgi:hypothetical protein
MQRSSGPSIPKNVSSLNQVQACEEKLIWFVTLCQVFSLHFPWSFLFDPVYDFGSSFQVHV